MDSAGMKNKLRTYTLQIDCESSGYAAYL